jgi:hypothetical protein
MRAYGEDWLGEADRSPAAVDQAALAVA